MIYFLFIKYLCLPIKDKVFVLWSYLLFGRNIWFTQILGKNNFFPNTNRSKEQFSIQYRISFNILPTFVYILSNNGWDEELRDGREADEGWGRGETGADHSDTHQLGLAAIRTQQMVRYWNYRRYIHYTTSPPSCQHLSRVSKTPHQFGDKRITDFNLSCELF